MCHLCNYKEMLREKNLTPTKNRLRVLAAVGDSPTPVSAAETHTSATHTRPLNIVTVYRILDLLVEHRIVERLSTGDRSFRYGLAPNTHHHRHAHFYCTTCGRMECLDPGAVRLSLEPEITYDSGRITRAEIRLDGTCTACRE